MTAQEYLDRFGEVRVRSDMSIVQDHGFVGMFQPRFVQEVLELLAKLDERRIYG